MNASCTRERNECTWVVDGGAGSSLSSPPGALAWVDGPRLAAASTSAGVGCEKSSSGSPPRPGRGCDCCSSSSRVPSPRFNRWLDTMLDSASRAFACIAAQMAELSNEISPPLAADCACCVVPASTTMARAASTICTVMAASNSSATLSLVMLTTFGRVSVCWPVARNPLKLCVGALSRCSPGCSTSNTPSRNATPTNPIRTTAIFREPWRITCCVADTEPSYRNVAESKHSGSLDGSRISGWPEIHARPRRPLGSSTRCLLPTRRYSLLAGFTPSNEMRSWLKTCRPAPRKCPTAEMFTNPISPFATVIMCAVDPMLMWFSVSGCVPRNTNSGSLTRCTPGASRTGCALAAHVARPTYPGGMRRMCSVPSCTTASVREALRTSQNTVSTRCSPRPSARQSPVTLRVRASCPVLTRVVFPKR